VTRRIHCGINTDPANPQGNPSVQELQDLGAAWVRFTFKDDSAASQPSSFGRYDPVVQDLSAAGIRILMILSYETFPDHPAADADEAAWSAYGEKFVARCRQIAEHYGHQVKAYQIWNEPDHQDPKPEYDPRMRAEILGPLMQSAFTAIRQVSSAMVVVGGLASGQPSYIEQMEAATAGVLHADAVGVHPYGRRPTEDWPRPDWGFGTVGELIQRYRDVTDKPIWITEMGTRDLDVQDDFPGRTCEALNEDLAEVVPYVFWFCWSDGMVIPFGVMGAGNAKKGSYDSFKAFATLPMEVEPLELPVVDYESHYVLFPGGAPWAWYHASRRYFRKYRVTRGESLDDAAKVHGTLGHRITCINPADDALAYLERLNPEAELNIIRVNSAAELETIMNHRADNNLPFG
jgi:hypothetical protein